MQVSNYFELVKYVVNGATPTAGAALSPELLDLVDATQQKEPRARPDTIRLATTPFFEVHARAPCDLRPFLCANCGGDVAKELSNEI